MKQLKDYLHYYLGCEVKVVDRIDIGKLHGCVNNQYALGFGKDFRLIQSYRANQIQPILRPLSDMTEDEMDEASAAWLTGNKMDKKPYSFTADANVVHYLLSKHFDIFNLIPAGLAIDKTNQPA